MTGKYILDDGGDPIEESDLTKWAIWFESANRSIDRTVISDDVFVSTVFLGINHNFGDSGPAILYETMIFGGDHDEYQTRCATKEEAVKRHETAVSIAKGESQ